MLADDEEQLRPLRQWASNRLEIDREHGVVRLDQELIRELVIRFGLTDRDLVSFLMAYTPDAAPPRWPVPPRS
jgi:hypothetical protein